MFYWVFLALLLLGLSQPINAQTVVIDPVSGATLNITTSNPLVGINNIPDSLEVAIGDDGRATIPLEFQFPLYDQLFDYSAMYSNGTVSFGPSINSYYNFCCNGVDLTTLSSTGTIQYNYSLFALWTDLFSHDNTTYFLSEPTRMTYGWYGVTEYGNNNVNSFEIEINESGDVEMRYGSALLTNHQVTIGILGDATQDQYIQAYYGYGFDLEQNFNIELPASPCEIDPLYSPTCAGYEQAYLIQQCSLNPLYSTQCVGYQEAYFNQQCSANPFYDAQCPGYAQAYAITYLLPGLEQVATVTNTFEGEPALAKYLASDSVIDLASYDDSSFSTLVEQNEINELEMTVEKNESKQEEKPKSAAEIRAIATNLAKAMSEAATFEAQQQIQAQILSTIGMLPGFEAYYTTILDAPFYVVEDIYQNVKLEENKQALRMGLASEVRFDQMLRIQYSLGE